VRRVRIPERVRRVAVAGLRIDGQLPGGRSQLRVSAAPGGRHRGVAGAEGGKSVAALFPGDRQDLFLQSGRQEEPGSGAQCLDLGLHQRDLAIDLGPQQNSKDASDLQTRSLGRAAPVPLFQQDEIRRKFQRQRDGLGLAGIEIGCQQSRNLVLPKCLRLDPTVLESLLDLRQRRPVRKLAEFGLDGAGDANFAELALQQIGRPMIARFEIGEVLLATSIGNVLRQLRLAVVPGDASLPHHFAESHSIHLGEFGGLTQR